MQIIVIYDYVASEGKQVNCDFLDLTKSSFKWTNIKCVYNGTIQKGSKMCLSLIIDNFTVYFWFSYLSLKWAVSIFYYVLWPDCDIDMAGGICR